MSYDKLANKTSVEKVVKALRGKGYEAMIVKNGKDALTKIKNSIPEGKSVMNGSSVTLEQIGYKDLLTSGKHKWLDLHAKVTAEDDKVKRDKLRREADLSDFYLGSVHALIETGEFIVASNSGSQLPPIVYTSPNLIFIVSTKKIVPTLDEGLKRLEQYVVPLENKHMLDLYGAGTQLNKIVIFKGENPMSGRNIRFILVEEDLGF